MRRAWLITLLAIVGLVWVQALRSGSGEGARYQPASTPAQADNSWSLTDTPLSSVSLGVPRGPSGDPDRTARSPVVAANPAPRPIPAAASRTLVGPAEATAATTAQPVPRVRPARTAQPDLRGRPGLDFPRSRSSS
jgi:hypothetical protein